MVKGVLFSADLAHQWARYAESIAGKEGSSLITRLEDYFSAREIGLLGAAIGANALYAFSRNLTTVADGEPTDPGVELPIDDLDIELFPIPPRRK